MNLNLERVLVWILYRSVQIYYADALMKVSIEDN